MIVIKERGTEGNSYLFTNWQNQFMFVSFSNITEICIGPLINICRISSTKSVTFFFAWCLYFYFKCDKLCNTWFFNLKIVFKLFFMLSKNLSKGPFTLFRNLLRSEIQFLGSFYIIKLEVANWRLWKKINILKMFSLFLMLE